MKQAYSLRCFVPEYPASCAVLERFKQEWFGSVGN